MAPFLLELAKNRRERFVPDLERLPDGDLGERPWCPLEKAKHQLVDGDLDTVRRRSNSGSGTLFSVVCIEVDDVERRGSSWSRHDAKGDGVRSRSGAMLEREEHRTVGLALEGRPVVVGGMDLAAPTHGFSRLRGTT